MARDFGKWPHELDELDVDELTRIQAVYVVEHFERGGERVAG